MNRTLTCIICPRGCSLTVSGSGEAMAVSGNHCSRGERYGIDECTHPSRTVTSVISVANRPDTMLSIKTSVPIPKEYIKSAMFLIRSLQVKAPIQIGQVIRRNVYGSDIVATRNIP